MSKTIGPKPTFTALVDAPAEGSAVVMTINVTHEGQTLTSHGCALLGPGRDYLTRDDAVEVANGFVAPVVTCDVSREYDSMVELVTDFPEAKLDGTARRMLAAERARVEYAEALKVWEAEVEAAGLEPCDRCGGAGGWRGWPGFTCYECNGSGTQAKVEA